MLVNALFFVFVFCSLVELYLLNFCAYIFTVFVLITGKKEKKKMLVNALFLVFVVVVFVVVLVVGCVCFVGCGGGGCVISVVVI